MSNQQQKIKKKQTRNSYPQELQEQLADYARQAPRNGQELSNKALEIFGVRLPQGTMSGMLKKYGIIIHQENKRGRRPRHLTNTLLSSSSLSSSSSSSSSSSTFINNPNTNNANTSSSSSSTISQLFSLSSIKYGCQLDKPAPKVRRFRLSSFRLTEPFILEYVYSKLLSGTIPSPRSIYIATKQYIIANNINTTNTTTTTNNTTTATTSSTNNQQPSNYTSNFNQGSVKRILKKYLLTYKLDAVFKELISPQDYLLEIKEKYPMIADIKDFDLENLDYSNSSRSFTTFTSSTFDQQQMNSTPTIVEEDENDDDDNDDDEEEEEEDPFIPGENKGLFDDHYFDIFKDKELSTSIDIPDTFKFFSSDDDDNDDDSDELNVEHFSNYESLQQQQQQQYQQDQNEEEEEKDFESLQQQYEETHLQDQTEEDFESFLSKLLKKNDDDDSSNDNDDDYNDLKKDNDDINQNHEKSESEKVVILQSHSPILSIVTSDLQNSFDYSSSSLSSSSSKFCPSSSSSFTFDFVSPSTTVPSSPYDVLSPIFSNNTTTSSNVFTTSSSSTMFEDERRKRRKTNTLFPLKQNQLSSPLSKSPTIVENNLDFLISDEIFNFEL